jgi:hypothetical protein
MIEDIEIFKKFKEDCSNIFLLDENLCLSNSYNIINYNIQSLSSALISLQPTIDYFNNQYTYFTQNSSKILEVNENLKNKTKNLNDIYTLTTSNSSFFNKVIYVSYETPINVLDWNSNINTNPSYYQDFFKDWLSRYYLNSKYTENQNIVVNVLLYFEQQFNLSHNGQQTIETRNDPNTGFYREFLEECKPDFGIPKVVPCKADSCKLPHKGCNIHTKNQSYCFNAYTKCKKTPKETGSAIAGNCLGTGSKILKISDNFITKDRYTSTSINFLYKNINSVWTYNNILT